MYESFLLVNEHIGLCFIDAGKLNPVDGVGQYQDQDIYFIGYW
jgi:hypothetical protein